MAFFEKLFEGDMGPSDGCPSCGVTFSDGPTPNCEDPEGCGKNAEDADDFDLDEDELDDEDLDLDEVEELDFDNETD